MKHPISLLAIIFGFAAAMLLMFPAVREQISGGLIVCFGTFFYMLLNGAALDYWADRDPDFWKRVRRFRLFHRHHN